MSRAVAVDLFVEDRAHAALLEPLACRIASEDGIRLDIQVRSGRGGYGRSVAEFGSYQDALDRGVLERTPDLIVVGIDGNCTTFAKKREEIAAATRDALHSRVVAACPDPHVERWFLADPDSFFEVVGKRPVVGKRKCARDHYKQLLGQAIRDAGHPAPLGGIEFAAELVEAMDFYKAGKADASLKAFVEDFRNKLRSLASIEEGDCG